MISISYYWECAKRESCEENMQKHNKKVEKIWIIPFGFFHEYTIVRCHLTYNIGLFKYTRQYIF